jgi:hypothetical protein
MPPLLLLLLLLLTMTMIMVLLMQVPAHLISKMPPPLLSHWQLS